MPMHENRQHFGITENYVNIFPICLHKLSSETIHAQCITNYECVLEVEVEVKASQMLSQLSKFIITALTRQLKHGRFILEHCHFI